jgi:hypothetical protein
LLRLAEAVQWYAGTPRLGLFVVLLILLLGIRVSGFRV